MRVALHNKQGTERMALCWRNLGSEFFGESKFRFVDDFFETAEAGKRKPVNGDPTDLADWRIFHRRPATFLMDQDHHDAFLRTNRWNMSR